MEREQFTFYRSFFQALRRIKNDADRAAAYDAICEYALNGNLPDVDSLCDVAAVAFELIRPNLDASRKKAKAGQEGGSKPEANAEDTASKPEANSKDTGSKKEKEIEYKNEYKKEIENKSLNNRSVRFVPPSLEEVFAYCQERHNTVDAHRFCDYYTANGWHVGKQKMKDWKAAIRTWERERKPAAAGKMAYILDALEASDDGQGNTGVSGPYGCALDKLPPPGE